MPISGVDSWLPMIKVCRSTIFAGVSGILIRPRKRKFWTTTLRACWSL